MGSGKSTLLREYDRSKVDFKTPEGLRSDFFDVSFGLEENNVRFYFYELDSPTVLGVAWKDYIKIAEGVIIVYDCLYGERYGTMDELCNHLLTRTKGDAPFLFVANKTEDEESGLKDINRLCQPDKITDRKVGTHVVLKARSKEDELGQPMICLDPAEINGIFDWMLKALSTK